MDQTPQKAFAESFINVPHTVLGVRLHPLCLRHLLWLQEINNPLTCGGKAPTLTDLELAVIVCNSPSDTAILNQFNGGKSLFSRLRLNFWRRGNKKRSLSNELSKFVQYYADYFSLPKFYDRKEAPEPKIPYLLLHAAQAAKTTGWTESEVFNMPIGKLIWFNPAFNFLETGESTIVSEAEMVADRVLASLNESNDKAA